MDWVDFVELVGTLLDPVHSAEEDNPIVEDVDFKVFRGCGIFEGRGDGIMAGIDVNAVDKR